MIIPRTVTEVASMFGRHTIVEIDQQYYTVAEILRLSKVGKFGKLGVKEYCYDIKQQLLKIELL